MEEYRVFFKDKNGKLVMIDNPRFDPVLDYLTQNHIPLIGHLGEHKNSWLPLEKMTVNGNRDYARAHPVPARTASFNFHI